MKTSNESNELKEHGMRNYLVLTVVDFVACSSQNLLLKFKGPKSSKSTMRGKKPNGMVNGQFFTIY